MMDVFRVFRSVSLHTLTAGMKNPAGANQLDEAHLLKISVGLGLDTSQRKDDSCLRQILMKFYQGLAGRKIQAGDSAAVYNQPANG